MLGHGQANDWCTEGVELLASQQLERCQTTEFAVAAVRKLDTFTSGAPHKDLPMPLDLFAGQEDVISPETKGLLQQVTVKMGEKFANNNIY